MQQLKFILVTSLLISCMADDMKKHQSNATMTDQKAKDMKPASGDSKTMKDAKSTPSNDAKSTSLDHTHMDSKMMDSKIMNSKMMDSKSMDSKTMGSKSTEDAPADTKHMPGAAQKYSNEQPKPDGMTKSKEDMKAESTVGLGFYAGVAPVSYGGYNGYGYGYPSYPYYQSYYARPYYSYPYRSYRPIVPVIVKPRPVPVLLG